MAGRPLSPEEQARWAELARTVTPLRRHPRARLPLATPPVESPAAPANPPGVAALSHSGPTPARPAHGFRPVPVLDHRWEKAIRSGGLAPDHSLDLHGHDLASAHLRLDRALAQAVQSGHRVLLVVTGRPRPHEPREGDRRRGAIRAEIGDWLAHSPHAARIASVRVAHPRHGGAGALYIILRRPAAR